MTNLAIAAHGLRKSYGDKTVLDGIDLNVEEGTVFALLGPNRSRQDHRRQDPLHPRLPDHGRQAPSGRRPRPRHPGTRRPARRDRRHRPVLRRRRPDHRRGRTCSSWPTCTTSPKEEGRRVAAELLTRFDLTDAAKKPASTYSGGMKRRLDIAMTLVGNPGSSSSTNRPPASTPAPATTCGASSANSSTTASPSSSPPSTSKKPTNSPTASPCSTTARSPPKALADELKRLIPGGHVRLRFTDPLAYQSAATGALREATRDDEALTLQVPSDGSQRELRRILDQLDAAGIRGRRD